MLKKLFGLIISALITTFGFIAISYFLPDLSEMLGYSLHGTSLLGMSLPILVIVAFTIFLFAWLGLVLGPILANSLFNFSDNITSVLSRIPTSDILVMVFGAGVGLMLANLIGNPFSRLPFFGPYIPIVFSLLLSVIGAKLALRRSEDIVGFFMRGLGLKFGKGNSHESTADIPEGPLKDCFTVPNKLLDTSVIIDGRVMDIMAAGFLEGKLIIPTFVIEELQKLSDSADNLKRAKGRRGLDFVQDMHTNYNSQVVIVDYDYEDVVGVDNKLLRLAKEAEAVIITNDFNLNKVAEIQNIEVLNINELANAIKPVVIAGEEMTVFLVKEGKEQGQALAYLEDGTMIVVENGRRYIGSSQRIVVSSVLQTAAGRMIFAKIQ